MAARKYIPVGARYGRLTVVAEAASRRTETGVPRRYLIVKCDCGTVRESPLHSLEHGMSRSCGCLHREKVTKHGLSESPAWRSWDAMVNRCRNPKTIGWKRYGGRGIKVCERWKDFVNFLADMGERPPGASLDRINNDGDYEPGNCRWATNKQQSANRRNTRYIETSLGRMTAVRLAEITGLPRSTIKSRVYLGWTGDDLLLPPDKTRRRQIASLPQGACEKVAP